MGFLRWAFDFYRRLPRAFSLSFPLLLAAFGSLSGHLMTYAQIEVIEDTLQRSLPALGAALAAVPLPLKILVEGAGFLTLFVTTFLLAFNFAALLARVTLRPTPFPVAAGEVDPLGPPAPADPAPADPAPADPAHATPAAQGDPGCPGGSLAGLRIGIVLAGGGAKGVYQAGALKAVHEYLAARGALGQVRVVCGTSIGSWNTLFWSAGLLRVPEGGGPSAHERWWKTTPMARVVAPATYRPLQNYVFTNRPWKQHFRAIFAENPAVKRRLAALVSGESPLGFYLTRSNVAKGRLAFSSNRPAPADAAPLAWAWGDGDSLHGLDTETALRRLEAAVYASMDLPPAFPFSRLEEDPGQLYEDGGVVDNLPVRFVTEYEDCDLVFVLPLNATFESSPSERSILLRLLRVLNVRQGALERRSMAMIGARNRLLKAEGKRPMSVFAVCPDQPLAVNTLDFGTAAVPGCFDTMYETTKRLLETEMPTCLAGGEVRLFLVSPDGSVPAPEVMGSRDC